MERYNLYMNERIIQYFEDNKMIWDYRNNSDEDMQSAAEQIKEYAKNNKNCSYIIL